MDHKAPHVPLRIWLLAARLKTLTAAVIPVCAGSALAYRITGEHHLWITLCALVSALCIQVGTNFINDAIDFKKGTDTSERLGPIRAAQQGLIDPPQLLKAGAIVFVSAVLFGIPLVIHGGLPILIIGLFSVLFGYTYTSGPFPLAYNGLGEIFVILFFGLIAVNGMYYLHTGSCSIWGIVLGLQIGLLATLIIEINNLRDIRGDALNKKRTVAVLLGERCARRLIELTAFLPFCLGVFWIQVSPLMAAAPLLTLKYAAGISHDLQDKEPSKEFNRYLGKAALLHALFGSLITLSLLL